MAHATRKIGFRRLHQQMVVIGHQTIGADSDALNLPCFFEQFEKQFIIVFVVENTLIATTSVHDRVPGIGIIYSQGVLHGYGGDQKAR